MFLPSREILLLILSFLSLSFLSIADETVSGDNIEVPTTEQDSRVPQLLEKEPNSRILLEEVPTAFRGSDADFVVSEFEPAGSSATVNEGEDNHIEQEDLVTRRKELSLDDVKIQNQRITVRANYTVAFENSSLTDIVWSGDVSTLSRLMDVYGVESLTENNKGATASAVAIYKGNLEAVQLLLTRGKVAIDTQGDTGNTFLIWAVYWNQPAVVSYLIESGADLNLKNKHGKSALNVAYEQGHTELVRTLLSAGASVM